MRTLRSTRYDTVDRVNDTARSVAYTGVDGAIRLCDSSGANQSLDAIAVRAYVRAMTHDDHSLNQQIPEQSASIEGADAHTDARVEAISHTMTAIRAVLADDRAEREQLVDVEEALVELASHRTLFGAGAFPVPTETVDRNFLVHLDPDDTLALYVCTAKPGVAYQPHDHGNTWAAVAAVNGAQAHSFYSTDSGTLERVGGAVCQPGESVSIPSEGIHSIEGGPEPLVHLHLYGVAFERQSLRREFDPDTHEERRFRLEDLSFIEDRRPGIVSK